MSRKSKYVLRARPRLLYAGICGDRESTAPNPELVLISSGSGKVDAGGHEYPFAGGDLLLVNPGTAHAEQFDGDGEQVFMGVGNLRLGSLPLGTLLSEHDFTLIHTQSYGPALHTYATQLVAEAEGKEPLSTEIAGELLKVFLLASLRLVAFDPALTFAENKTYLRAKQYFDENYTKIESIENVCKSLYVNKFYLTHVFSQKEGVSPVQYLIAKRIALACTLLETTDDNVADVAKKCGYPDPCYFSRTFKKVKKVTPLRYRYLFKEDRKKEK